MESLEEGLNTSHGVTSKRDHDQEYGESMALEKIYDDGGVIRGKLDGFHGAATHDYTEGAVLMAGSTAIVEKTELFDVKELDQILFQYPEPAMGVLLVGAALGYYGGVDKFGVLESLRDLEKYVEEFRSYGGFRDKDGSESRETSTDFRNIDLEESRGELTEDMDEVLED